MLRFVVADDDDLARDVVCRALRGPKIEICRASNGVELIELIANEGSFDLVVTEMVMPSLNGLQAMRSVRRAAPDLPFVLLTGLADPTLRRRVETLGRARLLRKPVNMSELRSCVGALLAQSITAS